MTATKHITIWCDFNECVEWTDHGKPTAQETRILAKGEGWTRRRVGMSYEDLCENHSRVTEDVR